LPAFVDEHGMSAAAKKQQTVDEVENLIRTFPLVEGFPDHLVQTLARASQWIEVPVHTQILQQGQKNEYLYFLVSGQVGVYVDGGRVSKMQRAGDLLGEMSVISNREVGATILSETPVTVLRVDSREILQIEGPERDYYRSMLYRIYATVLSEKLNVTNQKAKHFEQMTLQLTATQLQLEESNATLEKKVEERTARLEQQKAELMASNTKMTDLLNSKNVLFGKLADFNSRQLAPLKGYLDSIRKSNPDEQVLSDARQVVFDVQKLLGPLIDQYAAELAMKSKRVLLADSNRKQQIIAKMALGGTGVELDMASTIEEGQAKLANGQYDLLFLDAGMLDLASQLTGKNVNVGMVLMTSEYVPVYLPKLKSLPSIPHIVSRDEADRTFTVKNIMTTVTKLLSRDLFGLEKYLSWGVDIQTTSITGSRQRAGLIQQVESYFEKLGVRRANRDRIHAVLEEMLMNAIYDAPVNGQGGSLYNHLSRSVDVALKAEEQGMLRFATDGMLVAVSVTDPFGALQGSTILRYLEHNYAGDAMDLQDKEKKGGAGRGLHQIVENSDLVVFNIDPGKKTEVIALFNVEVSTKVQQNSSFHLFIKS
jgi:CRP-like cAMP-binding protein